MHGMTRQLESRERQEHRECTEGVFEDVNGEMRECPFIGDVEVNLYNIFSDSFSCWWVCPMCGTEHHEYQEVE